jgi:hypothetical protein
MAFQIISCTLTQQLLQTIQRDYNLKDDLVDKYLGTQTVTAVPLPPPATPPVKEKKKRQIKEKPADQLCTGKTAKGEPCKFAVKCDGLCGIHLRQLNKESTKEPKAPKKVKKVKEVPVHTHPLSEESDDTCVLCETQGNVMEPELTKAEFEAVAQDGLSIQERLKAILASADEDPEDPEEGIPVSTQPEEEVSTQPEEDDVNLKAKLAKLIAEEDDEDEDDVEVEQLCETPPSQARLAELMGKLSTTDGKSYNFDALCEEMEEE